MKPDLAVMLERTAEREGVKKSVIVERALRHELDCPTPGKLYARVEPRRLSELHDLAALWDRSVDEIADALIRVALHSLTLDEVDPELRRRRAAEKAAELLAA